MSAFTAKDFNAAVYSDFRPSYPDDWYKTLAAYHKGNHHLVLDIGCGPGTATFALRKHMPFEKVVGADISQTMVEKARKVASDSNQQEVQFVAYNGDIKEIGLKPDMVTMAECAHWLDWENAMEQVAAVLPSDGTLAIWCYVDPVFVDFPEPDSDIENLQYSEPPAGLGPYWEQPGRQNLRELLPKLPPPEKWFKDIQLWRHDGRSTATRAATPLVMEKTMTLEAFHNYTTTWSSYHNWSSSTNAGESHPDPTIPFMEKVKRVTKLESRDTIRVAWKTVALLARRK